MGTKIVPGVLAQASRALRRYAQAYRSLVRLSNVWPGDGSFADRSTARDLLLQDRDRFVERRRVIGLDVRWLAQFWLLPCGAMGAVIVGAWLVEAKQNVIENIAPVLTRLFTPLFTAVLLGFLATMAWTGSGIDVKREVLIGFDLLLVVVLGMLLYAVSARDPLARPDAFDALQLLLVVSALVVDAVALVAVAARISEFGFSANRVAALGENLILFVNLAWSAWLYARFLSRRGSFAALEQWQTAYLPVYSAWAALVVVLFPPLFGYA